ncbi:hypothetical protein M9Y10_037343 [Tritrichomonas musculus]|uniref:DUF3447 domain-containing protein n=1 Tax=Tritrichomonas musculus TaxID=1915356 RepID=A0ABR2GS96_9EUKA
MFIVDQSIADLMLIERHFDRYKFYFYPEIKPFLTEQMRISIEKELTDSDPDIFKNFEEKREIGENDSYLCQIIRNDSIDEFVIYVNQTNLSISTENIKPSIFETNFFLLKRIFIISLTDYAVFFGAIQIINFLRLNNVRMSSSLWLYAIHSNNAELIHLIEGEKVRKMVDLRYLKEAIKCHHNDIANYIQTNCLQDEKINFYDNPISYGFHFHNFEYLPDDITSENVIFYACKYDYPEIVNQILILLTFCYHSQKLNLKKMLLSKFLQILLILEKNLFVNVHHYNK